MGTPLRVNRCSSRPTGHDRPPRLCVAAASTPERAAR